MSDETVRVPRAEWDAMEAVWSEDSTAEEFVERIAMPLHRLVTAKRRLGSSLDGAALIAAERQRQVEAEGWTPEHDDRHNRGELAAAGAAYAARAAASSGQGLDADEMGVELWPWELDGFKPTNALRDSIKAGALIAAEIDRLLAEAGDR